MIICARVPTSPAARSNWTAPPPNRKGVCDGKPRNHPQPIWRPGTAGTGIRHTAINVNFHDIYVRTGLYKTLALPGVPGLDAVGVVEATGPGETRFKPGERIGWISASYGGYSARRILPPKPQHP